jgi:hypothetical protein
MISCYELRLGNRLLVNDKLQQVSGITATTVCTIDAEESDELTASEYAREKLEPVAHR